MGFRMARFVKERRSAIPSKAPNVVSGTGYLRAAAAIQDFIGVHEECQLLANLLAADPLLQDFRDADRAVCSLVVFEDGDQCS